MFCIVCRRQSTLLSPTSVWPLASPVTSPGDCQSAPFPITGTPAGTVGTSIRPASLDLKAHHKGKIVVSSPENNHRLSPKQVHPRQIAKRSLSFPFSPSKDGSKRLLRVSRSASTSGNEGFREDSTMKPMKLSRRSIKIDIHQSSTESLGDDSRAVKDESSDKRPNSNENSLLYLNSVSSREKYQVEPFYNGLNREQAKNTPNLNGVSSVSANTQTSLMPELVPVQISYLGTSKTCSNISEKTDCGNPTLDKPFDLQTNRKALTKVQEFEHFSPRTPSKSSILTYDLEKRHLTAREDPVTPSAIDMSSSNSFPVHRVVERAHLAMKDSPLPPLTVEPLSSPTSRGFSPFWPDSPIVFSSASDRIPFLSNTPVSRDGPPDKERTLSLKHKDNSCLNLSQPGDELFENGTTPNLTTRMNEAVSTSRDLGESPFGALEKKNSHNTSLDLEDWDKTSSFLNDKQALRSLRRAAAHHKSPKLNKNTESCDNLQAIDMEISEPSDIDPSGLFNAGAVDTLSKEDTRTRVSQLHDNLQTVDMEISESPQRPIVLGHASSCTPSVPLSNSTSRHSKINAASLSVFSEVGNGCEEGAGSNNGKTSHQTQLNSKNSSEHSDARVGESFARDEKALAENSATENAGVDSKILESGDIVEPLNIDIADDLELLSNGVALENDSTTRLTPTEIAQVVHGYNTESSDKPLLPSKMTNVSSKSSLAADTNTSKQTVPGIGTTPDDTEVTASEATIDQSAAKLPSKKRPYSCLVSSLDQDTDNSVPNDLRHNQDQTMLSKISDASSEKTCSLNGNSPTACTLTNSVAVGFSLSPKKSSKLCTQDDLATNCDQSCLRASDIERSAELSSVTPCKSSPRSLLESDSKLQTKEFEDRQKLKSNDNIDRPSSDDFTIKDKRNDYKPLAVNCTAFTKDASYFPEFTESQLGGVIETSLFQDWGLLKVATDSNKLHVRKEDSFVIEEHDECTEVADFGSEADQVLEAIERWPVIEDCDTLEPETVICSPMNSIETFTFRFPGECDFNEDSDTVSATETATTEEETILVEERFRGVCLVPEVVICSDENSEEMTTSDDILPRIVPTEKDNERPYLCKDLKSSGSQCEETQASDKVASVMPVLHTSVAELHVDELLKKRGSVCEDSSDLKGSCLIEQQFIRTDNCTEECSKSPAPQSSETSREEAVIQTKQPEVSPTLESEKEDVASPVFPKPDIRCTETLNTLSIPSVETTVNVALPTSVPQLSVNPRKDTTPTVKTGNHSSKMNEIRPGNAVGDGKKVVDCLDKLPYPREVNEIKKDGGKGTEKVTAANLPCPSESSEHVQQKGRDGNSTENVQEINFPKELQETRADPKQKTVNTSCTKPAALPVNCIADKLKLKSSSESKQFTAMLNKETSTELDSATSTRNSMKRNCGEVNSGTESTAVKDVFVKSVEPRAKIVKHDTFVEETTKTTAETLCVTASQPHFFKKPESYTQEGKAKDAHSGTSLDMHSRGRSEPLRDINDLQRDTNVLTGKRKHATEPENVAKQAKLTQVPFLVNAGEGVKHEHVPSEKLRQLSFGDYRRYTERGQCKYSQGDYHKAVHQQYLYPRWMAPALPTHLPVRNGEKGGLPNLVPNDPPWYQPRGVMNQNQFQQVYTRLPECGRPTYFPSMCKVRPVFAPTPAMPTTWSLPGNSCPVPYPMLGPR